MTTVNRKRLAASFIELCEIDSPSQREGKISRRLQKIFTELGAVEIHEDSTAEATGSECGNLVIRFAGQGAKKGEDGFFLSCHMDTVEPADGVRVVRNEDIFTSAGDTILGGDDKSGIAAIIELLMLLRENGADHPPIEIVLTVCEEMGLVGATHLAPERIQSAYGYALDSSGIDRVIVGAPAASKFAITVTGRAAHAGLAPERGVSALQLAVRALGELAVGRLDEESTRNFGVIEGGVAFNIIPESVVIHGEVRSHNAEKFAAYTEEIHHAFNTAIEGWHPDEYTEDVKPRYDFQQLAGYPALRLDMASPVIDRIRRAADVIGRELEYVVAGGGSDANIFFGKGLPTAIVATGMSKVHTTEEELDLNDLVSLVELLYSLATV